MIEILLQQLETLKSILLAMLVIVGGMTAQVDLPAQAGEPKDVLFGSATFGAATLTKEADILSAVSTLQDDYFIKNGKYFNAESKDDSDLSSLKLGKDIKIDQHKGGWRAILTWREGGYEYVKATGYGSQATTWEYSRLLGVASSTTP